MLSAFKLIGRLVRPVGVRNVHFNSSAAAAPFVDSMPLSIMMMNKTDINGGYFKNSSQMNQIIVPLQDPVSGVEYQMDSVMRKRRSKMKKHKLRKRRKREKAEKRKQSQG